MPAPAATKTRETFPEPIAWETREEARRGRFFRSWLMLLTQPSVFYRRMALKGGLGEPVSFQMLCAGFAFAITVVQFLLLYLVRPEQSFFAWFPGWQSTLAFVFNIVCVFLLVTPLFALMCTVDGLIWGAVARLVAGRGPHGAGVEGYFSVFAYATGPLLLTLVGGIGWVAGAIGWLILAYKGLRSAIGLGPPKAVAAIVAPLLLQGVLVVLAILIF